MMDLNLATMRGSLPKQSMPSPSFLARTKSVGLLPGAQSEGFQEEYEEMRQILSTLSARGVELPEGYTWRDESVKVHLQMAARHLGRGVVLGLMTVLRCFRRPRPMPLASLDEAGGGDESSSGGLARSNIRKTSSSGLDQDGVPDPEALAALGLIMPVGTWKEKWDMLILVFILYCAVIVPVRVCFSEEATGFLWLLEVTMTLSFLLDIYFVFNTIYFDNATGQWVAERPKIARNYLTGWFWIDAPSSVPIEIIDIFYESANLGLLRFLRMFRLLRLLRLLKVDEYIDMLEDAFDVNLRIMRVVFMLLKICFLSHILGCFWYYTAVLSQPSSETTWIHTYADGRLTEAGTPTSMRYLYSVYWAVTTLTTVGYGDLVPTNDTERIYALTAMLCSALVFGYMISNIGSLVASMDRQAAIIEEKTDAVKEYVAWRKLPRDVALRVKKHYSFYYSRRAAFDEVELLDGLSPSLRSEVTRFVLKSTLGKLPLFTQQLDPEFQMEVFPLIKPVSFTKGDTIFARGETSRDLIFLLQGEVSVHSPIDGGISSIITPEKEVVLSKETSAGAGQEEVMSIEHSGCFGESVLTGRRRHATHKAVEWCDTLVLTKDDLVGLFDRNPRAGKRMVKTLLSEVARKERLQVLMSRFIIGSLPRASPVRCAMIIQKMWSRVCARMAAGSGSSLAALHGYDEAPAAPAADFDANAEDGSIAALINDAVAKGGQMNEATRVSAEEVLMAAEQRVKALFEALKVDLKPAAVADAAAGAPLSAPTAAAPSGTSAR